MINESSSQLSTHRLQIQTFNVRNILKCIQFCKAFKSSRTMILIALIVCALCAMKMKIEINKFHGSRWVDPSTKVQVFYFLYRYSTSLFVSFQ